MASAPNSSNDSMIKIPSVCLPRVYIKFDSNYVEGVFCELFGPDAYGNSCVEKVDMVRKSDTRTGQDFWLVFVHFSHHMYLSDYLGDFVTRINNDEEVLLQYNPPWFWKVRKNKAATRKDVRTGPRIMSRKDEEEFMSRQKEILKQRNTNTDTAERVKDDSPASGSQSEKSWADIEEEDEDR